MTDASVPLIINGWSVYAHLLFLDQLEELIGDAEKRRAQDPDNYKSKNCTKRLAAIYKLVGEVIPSDPAGAQFRQGGTLGADRKHWFRAKFFQQYRLFFRFDSQSKIIVLGWVNDASTLRAYGSKTDAYETFKGMLDKGRPPDDFETLLTETRKASKRLAVAINTAAEP